MSSFLQILNASSQKHKEINAWGKRSAKILIFEGNYPE